MKWKRRMRVLLALAGLVLACFLALTWIAASRLICPERRLLQDYHREILAQPKDHGLRITPFTVKGGDGYDTPCLLCQPGAAPGLAIKGNKLRGELQNKGTPLQPWGQVIGTLMLLHGHSGRKEDMLPVAERFCAAGFRCLLPDLPGHGDHPAPFATFGFHEATLPLEVLREAARRFGFASQPAALFGVSQGGAIGLQAAEQDGDAWIAVAELSSFASLKELVDEQAVHYFGPLHGPAGVVMRWIVTKRAGFSLDQVRPVDAAARLRERPVLIGHGDADTFVSPKNAQKLWDAVPSPQKEFLHVPGANHSTVFVTSAPVYATLCRFFLRSVAEQQGAG